MDLNTSRTINIDLSVPALNKRIFDSCGKSKKLTKLRLDRNGINNDGMWSIVSFIGSDPPLEMLSIQGNNFFEKKCFDILVNNLKLNRTLIWLDLRYLLLFMQVSCDLYLRGPMAHGIANRDRDRE